jgi:hypothetical protein
MLRYIECIVPYYEKGLASFSTKWFFSSESDNINLYESLFFVVQNPFLNVEMDLAC